MNAQTGGQARGVLLISFDALRADRMGLYGADRPTTPCLDRLAAECLVFDRAFSPGPTTETACPAVMSSTLPLDAPPGKDPASVEGRPYLVRSLRDSGVRTALVHCHPLLSRAFGYADGVDLWAEARPEGRLRPEETVNPRARLRSAAAPVRSRLDGTPWRRPARWVYRRLDELLAPLARRSWDECAYVRADEMTDRAIAALREVTHGGGPWFLWVHYMEPHGPYFPPPECAEACGAALSRRAQRRVNRAYGRWFDVPQPDLRSVPIQAISRLYDAAVRFADREAGRLLECLRSSGEWGQCALIITSDHGEEFGEHGGMFHTEKLHRELLHVPLLVRAPGVAAGRVATPVSTMDLAPTVAALLGVAPQAAWKGESLLRFCGGEATSPRPVLSECRRRNATLLAATNTEFRLLRDEAGAWKAFRCDDNAETRNVYEEVRDDPRVRPLQALLERRLAEVPQRGAAAPRDDADVRRRLEALGYHP